MHCFHRIKLHVNLIFSKEHVGPDWHQLLLWSLAFLCSEHFAELPFKSHSVLDYVVLSAINGILENYKMPVEVQFHVLRVSYLTTLD